jgi:mannose-6-phosphate isomerase class I
VGGALTTYDRFPVQCVTANDSDCAQGWGDVGAVLSARARAAERCVIAVECYPGVHVREISAALEAALAPVLTVDAEEALKLPEELDAMLKPYLGDDPVFGFMYPLGLEEFFAPERLDALSRRVGEVDGPVLVVGTGASLVAPHADVLVYADVTRWEIQQRQRAHSAGNLGAGNATAPARQLYKRAYFVDWRAADRQRLTIFDRIDHYLDTNIPNNPRLVAGDLYRHALLQTSRRPFRLTPFFDPGPWGGHWMQRRFDLPDDVPNYAWCFDCVPEENSLLFGFGTRHLHSPALPLVHRHPEALLGRGIYEAFGAEFPIRFDFLDTMDGGNLSLQVHPLRHYIAEKFGVPYTQDESYYLLDAKPGSVVYLGLKESPDPAAFERELRDAQNGGPAFAPERYVNAWPSRKHDHFSIPAGTIHCSGKDNVVLEISATPYIFTFKLWDWARLGLDGKPRPIHLEHGLANIQWDRTTSWVERNLINPVDALASQPGVREETTGLHSSEFIETRRHWFTEPVEHDTRGTLNVLNLVEGEAVSVESPDDAFNPLTVRYAETFIVPASVGRYRIRPLNETTRAPLATIKALVRGSESTGVQV